MQDSKSEKMKEITSLPETTRSLLKKHGYHLAGTHSAVKHACGSIGVYAIQEHATNQSSTE